MFLSNKNSRQTCQARHLKFKLATEQNLRSENKAENRSGNKAFKSVKNFRSFKSPLKLPCSK